MNMRYVIPMIIAIMLIVGAYLFFWPKETEPSTAQIELDFTVRRYERADAKSVVSIAVPFTGTDARTHFLSAGFDVDGDGRFSTDEWLVQNIPVVPMAGQTRTYYVGEPTGLGSSVAVAVALDLRPVSDDVLSQPTPSMEKGAVADVAVQTYDASDLLALDTVTNPDEAMKGVGVALAQAELVSVIMNGVPDITQRPGECAPTTAANSIINLLNRNQDGAGDRLDPTELIDQLKATMHYTAENGVLPDDFVAGKNQWARDHGYPITTEKIGDANGLSTADAIKQALEQGKAVELRFKFGNAQGRAVGGHMVTVTGFHQFQGQTFIDVSDPASPEGVDTYQIESNQISDYPFNGFTVISWAFTQTWQAADSGTLTTPSATSENTNGTATEATNKNTNASSGEQTSVMPTTFSFTYDHLNPICPLPIGDLIITAPPGSYFNIEPRDVNSMPIWLNFPQGSAYDGGVQGFVSGPFPLEFPCQLDQYVNQIQAASFNVAVFNLGGTPIGSQVIDVQGEFTGF